MMLLLMNEKISQVAEKEEGSQEEDQIEEESTKGQSSSMMEIDQLVASDDRQNVDTSAQAEQDKEDPQDKANQPAIEGDSSLLNIMAT